MRTSAMRACRGSSPSTSPGIRRRSNTKAPHEGCKEEKDMFSHSKRWFAAACIAAAASAAALAQPYPQKPIKAIVPYGVGQATDVMCRVFLDRVRVELNQPIVIENKPGAGGNIGGAEAARSPADGYTVLCTGNATHISNPFLYENQGFDPEKDLVPITAIAGT